MQLLGLEPWRAAELLAGSPAYLRDVLQYFQRQDPQFPLQLDSLYPIVNERSGEAGTAKGAYFHQDLWAARKIFERRPARHVDIGSRIDGFISHLLVFMPVELVDIRELDCNVAGMVFVRDDATTLSRFDANSLDSLSTLHAVEHFGLGRYGDAIDPDAWRKAMAALARVLAPGGRLYFSVPIGRERVIFNSHRVFAPRTVLDGLAPLRLVSFSAVDDSGDFLPTADLDQFANAHGSVGLFELTK